MKRVKQQIILPLLAAVLLAAGCIREADIPGGGTTAQGGMRFEVQIDNHWSGASAPPTTTKAPVIGTAFSGSASGVTYSIGMSILRTADGVAYATGADHILAEMTVKTGEAITWRYRLKGSSNWINQLPVAAKGDDLTVSAYYPYSDATTVTEAGIGVPFDLTNSGQQADQTDLLYVPSVKVAEGAATLLTFRHFYSLMEFRIKKLRTYAATLTEAKVTNASGKSWVVGSGNYNPGTGVLSGTPAAGSVSRTGLNLTLTTTDYQTVQVMVPSRTAMDAYADGDIQVQFTINSETVPFLLKREYLFANGSTGLTAGMKYSFQLQYAKTWLELKPWEPGGAEGTPGYVGGDSNASLTLESWGTGGGDSTPGYVGGDSNASLPLEPWGTGGGEATPGGG